MADLTLVTPAALKTRYPAFKSADDGLVAAVLSEALGSVNDSWIETDQVPALLALTAHLLTKEGALADLDPLTTNGGFGTVQSLKAGDHEIKFGGPVSSSGGVSAGSSEFSATAFGIRYMELYRRSFPAVLVV